MIEIVMTESIIHYFIDGNRKQTRGSKQEEVVLKITIVHFLKHVKNPCCVNNRYNQIENGVGLYELPNNLSDTGFLDTMKKKSKSYNLEKFCITLEMQGWIHVKLMDQLFRSTISLILLRQMSIDINILSCPYVFIG